MAPKPIPKILMNALKPNLPKSVNGY